MDVKKLLADYFEESFTMQLATLGDDQPWICSVWYVADKLYNIYWASLPTSRHSQEIQKHPKVAGAIVIHNEIGEPVVGIQIEGLAEIQDPSPDYREIATKYAARFNRDRAWVEDFVAGFTKHRLYKLTPSSIYLFDEKNFARGKRHKVL